MKNQLNNNELEPLTDRQESQIEYIYMQVWHERGTIGGAKVWHDTIVRYLLNEGYEIKKPQSRKGGIDD